MESAIIVLVAVAKVALFNARLAKFNRRATKNGLDPWSVTELGEMTETVTTDRGTRVQRTYKRYSLIAAPLQIGDHTFLASLEQTGNGAIIRTAGDVPEGALVAFRNAAHNCDHCKVRRNRSKVYLVRNNETGAIMQVGKSCLRLYLGTDGPEKLFAYERLVEVASEFEGFGGGEYSVEIDDYLAHVVAHCRADGWRSKKAYDDASTSGQVWEAIFGTAPKHEGARREWFAWLEERRPTDADREKAIKTLAQAKCAFAKGGALSALTCTGKGRRYPTERPLSDFEHNLSVVALLLSVRSSESGLAAYLVPFIDREAARAQRKAEAPSNWVGEVKTRYKGVGAVYKGSRWVGGVDNYGQAWGFFVHSFLQGDDLITWKTGTVDFAERYGVEEGAQVIISYTVKSHNEYKGRKETRVLRVAVPTSARKVQRNIAKG